jgi:hypothetical protein
MIPISNLINTLSNRQKYLPLSEIRCVYVIPRFFMVYCVPSIYLSFAVGLPNENPTNEQEIAKTK